MSDTPVYKRILLKLSGEALLGDKGFGIDTKFVDRVAEEIRIIHQMGVKIGLVVGGGNIFRGITVAKEGGERTTGDHMGMLATVMNGLALKAGLTKIGVPARVFSGLAIPAVCDTFTQREARAAYERGEVTVFVGGTGNPFFTTDSGAALRAAEMDCDALMKATQVDGVYTADPKKDPTATRYERLTHKEVLAKGLGVMDAAAIALAGDNAIPVIVFSIHESGSVVDVVLGRGRATVVTA